MNPIRLPRYKPKNNFLLLTEMVYDTILSVKKFLTY